MMEVIGEPFVWHGIHHRMVILQWFTCERCFVDVLVRKDTDIFRKQTESVVEIRDSGEEKRHLMYLYENDEEYNVRM
jgi:hypothetical protein